MSTLSLSNSYKLHLGEDELKTIYDTAVEQGAKYLTDHPKLKSLVLGVSGGIDSAITLVLAREAIKRSQRDIALLGYSLPILTNEPEETERAKELAAKLCDSFGIINLANPYTALLSHKLMSIDDDPIRRGNIKARLRMMFLYNKASTFKGIVLSTDNLTEYLLGFWTLHGDVGDFGFIQELFKTEVYALAEFCIDEHFAPLTLMDSVIAKPTDGLGVSNSDLDQLLPGWTGSYREGYKEVDRVLISWLNAGSGIDDDMVNVEVEKFIYDHPVIQRHLATEFKRHNPANVSRTLLTGEIH